MSKTNKNRSYEVEELRLSKVRGGWSSPDIIKGVPRTWLPASEFGCWCSWKEMCTSSLPNFLLGHTPPPHSLDFLCQGALEGAEFWKLKIARSRKSSHRGKIRTCWLLGNFLFPMWCEGVKYLSGFRNPRSLFELEQVETLKPKRVISKTRLEWAFVFYSLALSGKGPCR